MSANVIDLTKCDDDIVYIIVDELDDKPKLFRRKSEQKIDKIENIEKLYICDNVCCNKTNVNMRKCTGCFYNRYCSSYCQKQDWSHHKSVCEHTCVGCQKIVNNMEVMKEVDYKGESIFVKYCSKKCEQGDKKFL